MARAPLLSYNRLDIDMRFPTGCIHVGQSTSATLALTILGKSLSGLKSNMKFIKLKVTQLNISYLGSS